MKILDVEQGGLDWAVARHAIPTCSAYQRIITQKTLKYAGAAGGYRSELLAEWALGVPLKSLDLGTGWTDRGKEMETEARRWYAWEREVKVRQVGFILRSDERTGGSPDGLVGDDGGVEIKCLGAAGHMKALLEGTDSEWNAQIQGLLYLTDRAWWDLTLYHPTLPRLITRVARDEKFILALHRHLGRFLSELDRGKRKLLEMDGFVPPAGAVMPGPEEPDEDALRNGTAPHPDELTEPEMAELADFLPEAVTRGLITFERSKEILELVVAGKWTEARAAWNEVMDLMLPRLPR